MVTRSSSTRRTSLTRLATVDRARASTSSSASGPPAETRSTTVSPLRIPTPGRRHGPPTYPSDEQTRASSSTRATKRTTDVELAARHARERERRRGDGGAKTIARGEDIMRRHWFVALVVVLGGWPSSAGR